MYAAMLFGFLVVTATAMMAVADLMNERDRFLEGI